MCCSRGDNHSVAATRPSSRCPSPLLQKPQPSHSHSTCSCHTRLERMAHTGELGSRAACSSRSARSYSLSQQGSCTRPWSRRSGTQAPASRTAGAGCIRRSRSRSREPSIQLSEEGRRVAGTRGWKQGEFDEFSEECCPLRRE